MNRMLLTILAIALFAGVPTTSHALTIEFSDPKNDDKGPGKYSYPTDDAYRKGDFDLRRVTIRTVGDNVEFKIRLRNEVRDVWKSKSWGGNGFSVQFVQVYIRTGKGKGYTKGLPGLNVKFAKPWNKVVLISPQGKTRLKSEINLKAKAFKQGVVLPTTTRSQGKQLIAIVPKSELGDLSKSWGFQVIVQSNEGYPRKQDLLTRPVNEYNGKHRFGGGNDGDCDPHVIDMLAGNGKGASSEKAAQYKALSSFSCAKGKNTWATLPFVYTK